MGVAPTQQPQSKSKLLYGAIGAASEASGAASTALAAADPAILAIGAPVDPPITNAIHGDVAVAPPSNTTMSRNSAVTGLHMSYQECLDAVGTR